VLVRSSYHCGRHEETGGSGGIAHLILNLGSVSRWVDGSMLRPSHLRGGIPRSLLAFRAGLDALEKIIYPCPRLSQTFLAIRPVSWSLDRLHHPGSEINHVIFINNALWAVLKLQQINVDVLQNVRMVNSCWKKPVHRKEKKSFRVITAKAFFWEELLGLCFCVINSRLLHPELFMDEFLRATLSLYLTCIRIFLVQLQHLSLTGN